MTAVSITPHLVDLPPWFRFAAADWAVEKVKNHFYSEKVMNIDRKEQTILSLTLRGVVVNNPASPEGLVPKDYGTYQIFETDDLVFKLIDLENVQTSRVGHVHRRGAMSPAYLRLRPRGGMKTRFAYWQFTDLYNRRVFNQLGGGVRATISMNELLKLPILVPPLDVQHAVVRYLDHAELRIARAVAAKRHLVALLSERRATVVQDIALGRLESSFDSYESEIPWIGRIPATWQVVPSKSLFAHRRERATPGTTIMTASQSRGIVPRDDFMALEGRRVMAVLTGDDILKQVEPNDFVISMRSFQGGLEWSHVSGAVSSAYVVMTPRVEVVPEYFAHLLKSRAYISALRATSDLVRDGQALRYANFGKVPLPLPPREDQVRLARQISKSVAEIDSAVLAVNEEIALLKEYRTRLISDVVTGKIDIREEAAKLTDLDPVELARMLAGGTDVIDEEEAVGDDE